MTARRGSLQLVRVFGIPIGVTPSWFLTLFVILFALQSQFRDTIGGSSTTAYGAALASAALLFGSIIVHELGHALAARYEGLHVRGIQLFLFGGLMDAEEPDSPGAEFKVAAAGPFATLLVILAAAAAGLGIGGWDELKDAATLASGAKVSVGMQIVSIVVTLNIFVLIFNLIPAYPLDGGRMARAAVWRFTGDRVKATRVAAAVGRAFGALLIVFALFLFGIGDVYGGIWFAAIGWMLGQSAKGAVVASAFTERLEGVTVADIMDAEPVAIPADASAERAFEDFFLRYGWDWFPVAETDGRYVGRAFRNPVQEAAHGANAAVPMREITGNDFDGRVPADAPLEALLASEPLRRLGALMAVDSDGRLRGVVTVDAVSRALRARLA